MLILVSKEPMTCAQPMTVKKANAAADALTAQQQQAVKQQKLMHHAMVPYKES